MSKDLGDVIEEFKKIAKESKKDPNFLLNEVIKPKEIAYKNAETAVEYALSGKGKISSDEEAKKIMALIGYSMSLADKKNPKNIKGSDLEKLELSENEIDNYDRQVFNSLGEEAYGQIYARIKDGEAGLDAIRRELTTAVPQAYITKKGRARVTRHGDLPPERRIKGGGELGEIVEEITGQPADTAKLSQGEQAYRLLGALGQSTSSLRPFTYSGKKEKEYKKAA